ncbi:MAG: hypothetical protein E6Q06_04225 [Candidatus Moraniibacteriota bacterium]|nr:MAG: hypothetical protein E6Q06_04225 [Candidatus Moranbacteria bacterium]
MTATNDNHEVDYDHLSAQQTEIAERVLAAARNNKKSLAAGGRAVDERVFLVTGCAGTGKSTLLRALQTKIEQARLNSLVGSAFGLSAVQSKGLTIHHLFRLEINPAYAVSVETRALTAELEPKYFANLDVLFLEEFSTCSNYMLSMIDERMRNFFKRPNEVFGGRVVVFIGDLLQLSPVTPNTPVQFKYQGVHRNVGFCFDSQTWETCVDDHKMAVYELEVNYRQSGDNDYAKHLNNIRCARLTRETCSKLLSRVLLVDPEQFPWPGGVAPTSLFGTLSQVAHANKCRFDKLPGEVVAIEAKFWPREDAAGMRELIKRSNVEPRYELKIGCQVMVRANVAVADNICNGTRGVVTRFEMEGNRVSGVWICLPCGSERLISPHVFSTPAKGGGDLARFIQIPLCLAWSMTIHKSQGLTIPWLLVDIGNTCFADSQIYVALSRTTCWDALFLRNVDFKRITVNEAVVSELLRLLPGSSTARLLNEASPLDGDTCSSWEDMYDFDQLVSERGAAAFTSSRQIIDRKRGREETVFEVVVPRLKKLGYGCFFTFPNSKNILGAIVKSDPLLAGVVDDPLTGLVWSGECRPGEIIDVSFERSPFLRSFVFFFEAAAALAASSSPTTKVAKTTGKICLFLMFVCVC